MYKKIDEQMMRRLEEIVGGDDLIKEPERMLDYCGDEFADASVRKNPQVVVKPESSEEIAHILRLASEEKIPVTPRGGGTGLCGGCVPLYGGIVLSMEKMNKVLEIDKDNMMAVVEAGLTLKDFYVKVEESALFFPPHPGDEGAQFGGLINTNASGARAVKYGGIRNYIKGIEVVLPQGEIITMGGKFVKNSTGYSLLNLLIGSEGTLGVVTKAVINLLPKSPAIYTLVVPYNSLDDAIMTVVEIRNKFIPMAIEFIEHDVLPPVEKLLNKQWPCKGKAYLMIIVDGAGEEEVLGIIEAIGNICLSHNAAIKSVHELSIADSKKRQEDVLEIRSNIYSALKKDTLELLDITIPPSKITAYLKKVHEISKKYNIWLPTYGHAGDGNVHTHLMKADKYLLARKELHEEAKRLEGIVSGEHGIGLAKKEYLSVFIDPRQIEIMKGIKRIFDPDNILNPGKIF